MICEKCKKKLELDEILKAQVFLVANKIKISKEEFRKEYDRLEQLIQEKDPDFYRG